MKSPEKEPQKLMDQLAPVSPGDPLVGLLATTFELQPEFVETDFLPTVFSLGAWDDRSWTSRVAIGRQLQQLRAAVLFQAADQYRGRPRSLHLEVVPVPRAGNRVLHAKVVLLVHESAVRLIVGSANLTEPGYRRNREVAVSLVASEQKPAHASLIRQCLAALPRALAGWWSDGAATVVADAAERLDAWMPDEETGTDEWFAWGGEEESLWRTFLDRWPRSEPVKTISIASPFWSQATTNGPIATLLTSLREAGCLASVTELRLLAEAGIENAGAKRPVLPESYATFDLRPFGVAARAFAVDPTVAREETGVDDTRLRALHAKVVLLEGATTSLAYLGSANFSRHGWGFLPHPRAANIEAGLILRRTGKSRGQLAGLLPPIVGPGVALDGSASGFLEGSKPEDPTPPWPIFVRDIRLVPDATDRYRLHLDMELDPELVAGDWTLELDGVDGSESPITLLAGGPADVSSPRRTALTPSQLKRLLYAPHIHVRWWGSSDPREYPINVDAAAREDLPVTPGAGKPGEFLLLQYYQSRITFEEMFPPLDPGQDGVDDPDQVRSEATAMNVDTSRIQSYQIREFVEALRGIHDDLRRAASAPGAMRQSLLGPVSPSALAIMVADAVEEGTRTATAGAFQLVELRACLAQARAFPVKESASDSWTKLIDEASARIEVQLERIRATAPEALRITSAFARYEKAVRGLGA